MEKNLRTGEFELIRRMLAESAEPPESLLVPPGDDCAVIQSPKNQEILVTTDMLVEDIHFRCRTSPGKLLGRKAVAVNLSDIAAMGGQPTFCFLSIGCPRSFPVDYLDEVISGMHQICKEYNLHLAGGDTTSSPDKLIINLCVLGVSDYGKGIKRSGAKPGDLIQVSGLLGGSAAGLHLLENSLSADSVAYKVLVEAHLNPTPRVALGQQLSKSGFVNSMIDISDGVLQDLGHICKSSQTGALIDFHKIPYFDEALSVFCGNKNKLIENALSGGEDYELCWTVPEDKAEQTLSIAHNSGLHNATTIGLITHSKSIKVMKDNSEIHFNQCGWDHFKY